MLRERGADPVTHPLIRIGPPPDPAAFAAAVASAGGYDWIVFTSANAVQAFFDAALSVGTDARVFGNAKVCVIGPATRDALLRFGIRADLMPSEYRGEAVAQALLDAEARRKGIRVLLPRALVARDALPDALREAGALVDIVAAYETLPPDEDACRAIRATIESGGVDVVALTSPSTVENLVRALGDSTQSLLSTVVVAAIGPITTAAARRLNVPIHVAAREYTTQGLLDALERYYTDKKHGLPD